MKNYSSYLFRSTKEYYLESKDFPKTWPRSESDFCSHLILTLPGRNISEKNEILGDKVPKSHVPLYFLYLDIIHANTRSKHYSKVFIG